MKKNKKIDVASENRGDGIKIVCFWILLLLLLYYFFNLYIYLFAFSIMNSSCSKAESNKPCGNEVNKSEELSYASSCSGFKKKQTKHLCSPFCIREDDLITQLKGVKLLSHSILIDQVNPFCVPLRLGWKRKSNFSKVIYITPCGIKLFRIKAVYKYLIQTKSKLSIDQFTFDKLLSLNNVSLSSKALFYEYDISKGQENLNIECINDLDDEKIDQAFIYNPNRVPGPDIDLTYDPEFLSCCDCQNNCFDSRYCDCQNRTFEEAFMLYGEDTNDSSGYYFKRLKSFSLSAVYECNSRCRCNSSCLNRVVQNGIKYRFQVFKTVDKGWGLRCLHDIPEGHFVCLYNGEVINQKTVDDPNRNNDYVAQLDYIEASNRPKEVEIEECLNDLSFSSQSSSSINTNSTEWEDLSEKSSENEECDDGFSEIDKFDKLDFNFFEKDENTKKRVIEQLASLDESDKKEKKLKLNSSFDNDLSEKGSQDSEKVSEEVNNDQLPLIKKYLSIDEMYCVDGKRIGNIGRFLNHSCDPNCRIRNIFVDNHDYRYPLIAFFSIKHIKALEELTWDYHYNPDLVYSDSKSCFCKSSTCKQIIY